MSNGYYDINLLGKVSHNDRCDQETMSSILNSENQQACRQTCARLLQGKCAKQFANARHSSDAGPNLDVCDILEYC